MKVLFVAKAGDSDIFKAVVQNQYNSLLNSSLTLKAFAIQGSGIISYINAFLPLIRLIRLFKPDIIHAHYSFSGILAAFGSHNIPVVTSLMGSDIESKNIWLSIIRFFSLYFWTKTLVKSKNLKDRLKIKSIFILPNGVDINKFKPIEKKEALKKIGWNKKHKNILFLANPLRIEKNVTLSKEAVKLINDKSIKLQTVSKAPASLVPYYLNAADVVILSSIWEGSPNVVKEAMACNRPIVATNVGDIEFLLKNIKGCYIVSFDPYDIANKIQIAIKNNYSSGRNKIISLGLSSDVVREKLISIYKDLLTNK